MKNNDINFNSRLKRLEGLIRIGTVSSVDKDKYSARVAFPAAGGSVSYELIVMRNVPSMDWSTSVRWHEHARHLLPPLLEFGGTAVDKISLTMTFARVLGIEPMDEMAKLLKAEREGQVMRLIIGTHAYGTHKWVIASSGRQMQYFDGAGNVSAAQVTVSLSAYNAR